MPRVDERVVRGARRPARRWPVVLAALAVAFSLSLTGFLFTRDRQNAAAATDAPANATQDALAFRALRHVATTLDLDASMRRVGVVGLRTIALDDLQSLLVTPLGGAVEMDPSQWTLALDGGWSCLTWQRGANRSGLVTASLGVCSDDTPLVSTTGVSPEQFHAAELRIARQQAAAIDAAGVAAAISSTSQGDASRFSLAALTSSFARLVGVGFRSTASGSGVTVATSTSTACLQPTATGVQVRVRLGPCH